MGQFSRKRTLTLTWPDGLTESVHQFQHRLNNEFRYEEFDTVRNRYMMDHGCNIEEATIALYADYPPTLESKSKKMDKIVVTRWGREYDVDVDPDSLDEWQLKELRSKQEIGMDEKINWVYEHVGQDRVSPDECPSVGAWHMRIWAKENMDKFYTTFAPRLLPSRNAVSEVDGLSEAADASLEDQVDLLDKFMGESKG